MKHVFKLFLIAVITVSFTSCNSENISSEDTQTLIEKAKGDSDEKDHCETGFAYCEVGSTCFSVDGFNRWGWRLGPLSQPLKEECVIYAGAGQCDLDKGTAVGYYEITYADDMVLVHYHAYAGYLFKEAHLYVGNAMYPTKPNGQPTVAPGKYPYKESFPEGTDFVEFEIDESFTGELYVIAHSVVCESGEDKPK